MALYALDTNRSDHAKSHGNQGGRSNVVKLRNTYHRTPIPHKSNVGTRLGLLGKFVARATVAVGERLLHKRKRDLFTKTVGRVQQQVSWQELSPRRLQQMYREIKRKQKELRDEVRRTEKQLKNNLKERNGYGFEQCQETDHDVRHIQRQYDHLQETKQKIFDCRQRQIIKRRMKKALGKNGSRILERAVLVLIFVVLAVLSYEMLYFPGSSEEIIGGFIGKPHLDAVGEIRRILWMLFWVDAAACSVFLAEFFLRFYHAEDKLWYWRHNWIDFVSSIPIPPIVMGWSDYQLWGRLVRLVRILRLWRAFRIISFLWRGMERLQRVTDVRMMKKSLVWILIIMISGAVLVFHLEGNVRVESQADGSRSEYVDVVKQTKDNRAEPDRLDSLPQSLWWSFVTVATGGFADLYKPQTAAARLITMFLIVTGLVVMGVFIATLAAVYRGEESEGFSLSQDKVTDPIASLQRSHQEIKDTLQQIKQSLG